ncbi:PEGA domain protein [Methanoregula boonei 6A8]|uniref:PEGA domain protein n=1 Tax=Methanoregula boonei (strain DSM 21154 / JCM 14090 / 6A8) TaxID=456442 RepID=A7I7K4_METB6|nr:PEGA domain-containing protein [Methanoregula boonei]ABS55715.1 PEGA domain protein [Methanoregula boonei 6A8]
MSSKNFPELFSWLLLAIILLLCIGPAQAGTVSITYRGSGGYYVGDSVILDGMNTVGNTTVITITGPGLPAAGVPPYNLTGDAGTGNTAVTDPSGTWSYDWDSSRALGASSLNPGRYTFTVYDNSNSQINSSVSVFLKQPEFYASISPNPAVLNDYVQVTGKVESAADTIGIDVIDASGNKVHTFSSPVSNGGYFQYGFHVDMPPGVYTVYISSPSLSNSLTSTLTVVESNANLTAVAPVISTQVTSPPASTGTPVAPQATATIPPGSGTLVISSVPAGASVYLDSANVGISPVTLNGVAPGTHLVEIKSPGYLTVSMDVVVTSDKPVEVSPQLVRAPFGLGLSPLAALGGCLGAAALFIVSRKK